MFHLTQYSQILSFQHIINTKLIDEVISSFVLILKSVAYFTLKTHLSLN